MLGRIAAAHKCHLHTIISPQTALLIFAPIMQGPGMISSGFGVAVQICSDGSGLWCCSEAVQSLSDVSRGPVRDGATKIGIRA